MALSGKVALVTGASRGIGKGIALQLGAAGATVYITGRTLKGQGGEGRGSLAETAEEVEERGGRCIPVQCDHSNDPDVEKLFAQISREQDGQLDILVNNAYAAVHAIMQNTEKKFWETPSMWDTVNNVGLRNHYLCTVHAAKMMVERKQGLIVFISSAGGLRYAINVPYGVGKAAVDRMAADCGHELRRHNVACVSLWPGGVRTENLMDAMNTGKALTKDIDRMKPVFENGETPEYSGKCVVSLAKDKNVMQKTGKILIGTDLGSEYGFVDIDNRQPMNMRSLRFALTLAGWHNIAKYCPAFLKVPRWVFHLAANKF